MRPTLDEAVDMLSRRSCSFEGGMIEATFFTLVYIWSTFSAPALASKTRRSHWDDICMKFKRAFSGGRSSSVDSASVVESVFEARVQRVKKIDLLLEVSFALAVQSHHPTPLPADAGAPALRAE
jgi:hypothetical protein